VPHRTRQGSRILAKTLTALLGALALMAALTASAAVAGSPSGSPANAFSPAIKGTPSDGKKLKVTRGVWEGAKPIAYSFQWQRCSATGDECATLSAAKGSSYQLSSEDVGHTLRALVTATNAQGAVTDTTSSSSKITPVGPHRRKSASIAGVAQDGQILTVTGGTWKGSQPMSFTYQWQSCRSGACTAIAGATAQSYRADTSELGEKLRAIVTATNSAGSSSAASKTSPKVIAGPPVSLTAPTISGLVLVGQTVSAEAGTWGGTGPFQYSYQWRSCNLLGECADIAGATEVTYTVSPLDVASSLQVVVTAANSLGSAQAFSAPTNAISAVLPSNTGLPSISGLLQDGGLLSAIAGSWSGTGPLAYSYEWELCNAVGASCEAVSGAAGSTLSLIAGEVGSTVRVIVTATNSAGSTSATSEASSLVTALLPTNTTLPSVSGLLQDGGLLSALTGSWSGTGPLSYSYQWESCNAAGGACQNIAEAGASTLNVIAGEVGSTLRVVITASNSAGSTSATSEASGLVKALLPSNTALPSISGLLQDGSSLTAAKGSWSGTSPLSYTYQWELCNAAGAACKNIAEAVSSGLGLIAGEVGSTVRVVVTATNSAGSTSATSEASGLVKALLPSNTTLPSISGLLQTGALLSALKGGWSGTEPISYAYQWQLCSALGGSCGNVSKATEPTFKLALLDVGLTLRVIVTATNAAGSTSATSAVTGLISGLL
jgi:uncharacterized protein YukE